MKTTELIPYSENTPLVKKLHYVSLRNKPMAETKGGKPPEILFITSFPPRECGIATYSQDLLKALNNKFKSSFNIKICALESADEKHFYTEAPKYIMDTEYPWTYSHLASTINADADIEVVVIQHEFGFFAESRLEFTLFIMKLIKPVVIAFHTVLPNPSVSLKKNVIDISGASESIIVMTHSSARILISDYGISADKITVIPHGTHLVPHSDKLYLKEKYNLSGKEVLSTFGLLSSGKSIETTLDALPAIIERNPNVLFLIIGKTHPGIVKQEGEKYRNMLEAKVIELKLEAHVKFINQFLPLPELLEYLQLTDIYLFTSKDHQQAVSGTFSYAISCGCPIISTPIPHSIEVLQNDAGIIIDFESNEQLSRAVNFLFSDKQVIANISLNGLHRMAPTAWENSAIAHASLFEKITEGRVLLNYIVPPINLSHIRKMTTDFGMIQFSKINQPDICSGYTLDDNSRALIAMCQHFELTHDEKDIEYIHLYYNFIKHCLQENGYFLNYIDEQENFTEQNDVTNLDDANGRAIWAIGYLVSKGNMFGRELGADAILTMQDAIVNVGNIHSTRAIAFIIKGLYYYSIQDSSSTVIDLIKLLADRLVQMYRHEATEEWQWFEGYLTYANSILPEAMLCAWLATGDSTYKYIAKYSFDFLLSKTFTEKSIKVITNKNWFHRGNGSVHAPTGGEQPIDVAYTILALSRFHHVFNDDGYKCKIEISLNWFLGNNHLNQIIYNPCTGGCYDGLEENYVNLNQGAESTVSYLMARLTVEQLNHNNQEIMIKQYQLPMLNL